jgi:hypothetical protein
MDSDDEDEDALAQDDSIALPEDQSSMLDTKYARDTKHADANLEKPDGRADFVDESLLDDLYGTAEPEEDSVFQFKEGTSCSHMNTILIC